MTGSIVCNCRRYISSACRHALLVLLLEVSVFAADGARKAPRVLPPEATSLFTPEWVSRPPLAECMAPPGSVVVGEHAMLAITTDMELLFLDADNGQTLWRTGLVDPDVIDYSLGRESALVTTADKGLISYSLHTGKEQWRFSTEGLIAFPLAHHGHVYFGTTRGEVYAMEEASGEILWTKNLAGTVWAAPSVAGGQLIVCTDDGRVFSLSLADGRTRWTTTIEGGVEVPGAVSGETFCVATSRGFAFGIDLVTGEVLWRAPVSPPDVSLMVAGDKLVVLGSYGIYNLTILDCASGRVLWKDAFSGIADSVPIAFDHILFCSTQGNVLHVFDLDMGIRLHRLELGASFQIAGISRGRIVLGVAETGILQLEPHICNFGLRLNIAKQGAPPTYVLVQGLAALGVLLIALTFALVGRPGIPGRHELTSRLWILCVAFLTYCTLGLYSSYLIIFRVLPHEFSVLGLAAAVLLAIPLALIVAAYCLYGRLGIRRLGSLREAEGRLAQTTRYFSEQLSWPRPVKAYVASTGGFSPFIVGMSRRHSRLVAPADLDDLIQQACRKDTELSRGLIDLVVCHELAHVKHGDATFMPFLWALRRPLAWCTAGFAFASIMAVLLHTSTSVSTILRPMLLLLFPTAGLVFAMMRSTLGERERLADATATLYVPPELRVKLMGGTRESQGVPPVEAFLFLLSKRPVFPPSYLGNPWPAGQVRGQNSLVSRLVFYKWRRSFGAFRSVAVERLEQLLSKRSLLRSKTLAPWSAVAAIGILGGIVMASFQVGRLLSFTHHMLLNDPPPWTSSVPPFVDIMLPENWTIA